MALDLKIICIFAAGAGVVSHLGWFIRGEHDLYARSYLLGWLGLQAAAFFFLTRIANYSYLSALIPLNFVSLSYLSALSASIITYRIFFHRLRSFPGPFSWKVSKLVQVGVNSDAKGYLHLDKLHQRYGNFVRIGPNEISTIDTAATQLVLGPGTKCRKAIWYDVGQPLVSMHQCRDKKLHDVRRRTWDKGFNSKCGCPAELLRSCC